MTPANIIMGFRATGVYPLNRYIVLQHVTKDLDSANCEIDQLASKMGIYVPFYTSEQLNDELLDDKDATSDDNDVDDNPMTTSGTDPVDNSPENEPSLLIRELLVLPTPPRSKDIRQECSPVLNI